MSETSEPLVRQPRRYRVWLIPGFLLCLFLLTAFATVLVKERVAPPVVRIEKGSVAIIGASDDRYYLVQPDGRTAILTGLNREDLCWRRSDER